MDTNISLATSPRPVNMELFNPPAGAAPQGGSIVVAYGTEGLKAPFGDLIREFCQDVANEGFTVVLPYFFEISATRPGLETVIPSLTDANVQLWTNALVAAVQWCRTNQPRDKVALVGFSLGSNFVVHAALATPVEGLVDFFGPMRTFGLMSFPPAAVVTQAMAADLPGTQIHHGTRDLIVNQSESQELERWLSAAGVSCDFHNDYRCGHPGQPELAWTNAAQKSATTRTIGFLKTHVQSKQQETSAAES